MNIFTDYIIIRKQNHISEKAVQKKTRSNARRTFYNMNRKKQINSILENNNEDKEKYISG
jgi:hypothetical protein